MELASSAYGDPAQGDGDPCDSPAIMWGRTRYPYPGKNLGTGNRCGHDPKRLANERLNLPAVANDQPLKIVTTLCEKFEEYFYEPGTVPLLAYQSESKNLDGSPRQNRSEGREAQSLVWKTIVSVLDYSSLLVAKPKKGGGHRHYTLDELARMCGLTEPGANAGDLPVASSRFHRVIEVFKQAGLITIFEQYEDTPDGPRGRPAIKSVSEKFLMSLGRISKLSMKRVRDKASKALRKWRNGAIQSGVQTDEEYEEVTVQVQSSRVNKALFPKAAIKNQRPKDVESGHAVVEGDWLAYQGMIEAKVREQNGGTTPRGIRAYQEAYAKAGGLSRDEWLTRRMRL